MARPRRIQEQVFCILSYDVFQGRIPHYTGQSRRDMLDAEWTSQPVTSVCLYGRAITGESVTVNVVVRPSLVVLLEKPEDADLVNAIARDVTHNRFTSSLNRLHRSDQFYKDPDSAVPAAKEFDVLFLEFDSMKALYMTRAQLMTRNPEFIENDSAMRGDIKKFLDVPHKASRDGKSAMVQVIEKFVPLQLRLMSKTGVRASHWARAVGLSVDSLSRDDVQLEVVLKNSDHALEFVAKDDLPPMRIHSFDLEVENPDGGFPDGDKPGHNIIAIASTTLETQNESFTKAVHGLCHYTPRPGVACFMYDSEASLIEGWIAWIIKENPDFLLGYNINGFDWPYLMKRVMRCLPSDSIFYFVGKLRCVPAIFKTISTSTKAFGKKDMHFLKAPGITNWDLLQFLKVDMPTEEDYSLNAIATKVLGHTKLDMPIPVMNQYYQSGDPDKQAQVMDYCVVDTSLPLEIVLKRQTLLAQIEMSRVCCVFFSDLWDRGQMFRVMSQFFLHARAKNYVLSTPNVKIDDAEKGYQGATVLDPEPGVHDALVLDFASLYPSMMMANNLCPSALVPDGPPLEPDGINYKSVQVDAQRTHTFQQSIPGLIPDLLRNLLEARKRAKKAEQDSQDPATKRIQNGRQKALKVAANSIYGAQGAQNTTVGCKAAAEACTRLGREGLQLCMDTLKGRELRGPNDEVLDLRIVYGDTDSLFFALDFPKTFGRPLKECLKEAFWIGNMITGILNPLFKRPISLEMEKVYGPLVLMAKKTYLGRKYLSVDDEGHLDASGYSYVKRDYSLWQREVMQEVIDRFVMQHDLPGSLQLLATKLNELVSVEPRALMLTKRLGHEYKTQNSVPCEVARLENEIEPGSGSKPGDRVQYVVCKGSGKLFTRVKPFRHATKDDIDLDYYAEHLVNPLTGFFECFGPEVLASIKTIFRNAAGDRYRLLNRNMDLSDFIQSTCAAVSTPRVMPRAVKSEVKRKQADWFGNEVVDQPKAKKARRPPRKVGKQAAIDFAPLTGN